MLEKQHEFLYHEPGSKDKPLNWYSTWHNLNIALFDLTVCHSFSQLDKEFNFYNKVNDNPDGEYVDFWSDWGPKKLERQDFEDEQDYESALERVKEERHHHDLRFKNVFKLEQEQQDTILGSFCLEDTRRIGLIEDGEATGRKVSGELLIIRVPKPELGNIGFFSDDPEERKGDELSLTVRVAAPEFDEFLRNLKEYTNPQCTMTISALLFQSEVDSFLCEYWHPQTFYIGENRFAYVFCNNLSVLAGGFVNTVQQRFEKNLPLEKSEQKEQPILTQLTTTQFKQAEQKPAQQLKTLPITIALWAVAIGLVMNAL